MTLAKRFQIEILPDLAWNEFSRRFRHAEELGFDVATTADQFVDWKNPSVPWFDVWTALAAVAQATEKIRLAPYVAQIPMRAPATFVRQVLTVDYISDGRVEAGLGLGLKVDPGYSMIGIPSWDYPERARRFKEYVEIVQQMLSGSPTDYIGTYYTMSFGAGAEALIADAATLKDKMKQACEAIGRDPSTLRHSFLMFDANARESGGQLFYWESTQQFADIAGQILALGFDEIGVYYPIDTQCDEFERIATDILPSLRKG